MVKERKLSVPCPTAFICMLPEATQHIIHDDLDQYAKENVFHLAWNSENNDYTAMAGRFCDIEEIYQDTVLRFRRPGEDTDT